MAKYPSQYTGQNFDTSVQRALNQFPGQISTLNTKVAALEEDVDDLSGLPAQVTQIGSNLDELSSVINGIEINYTEGKYINAQGELVDNTSYGVSDYIPINPDNDIVWTWGSTPANVTIYTVLFDANKTPYPSGYWASQFNKTSVTIGANSIQTFAPNAAFARVSFKLLELSAASVVQGSMTWTPRQGSEGLVDRVTAIEEEISNEFISNELYLNGKVELTNKIPLKRGYIEKNGTLTAYSTWYYAVIFLESGRTITVDNTGIGAYPSLGIAANGNVSIGDVLTVISGKTYTAVEDTWIVVSVGTELKSLVISTDKTYSKIEELYDSTDFSANGELFNKTFSVIKDSVGINERIELNKNCRGILISVEDGDILASDGLVLYYNQVSANNLIGKCKQGESQLFAIPNDANVVIIFENAPFLRNSGDVSVEAKFISYLDYEQLLYSRNETNDRIAADDALKTTIDEESSRIDNNISELRKEVGLPYEEVVTLKGSGASESIYLETSAKAGSHLTITLVDDENIIKDQSSYLPLYHGAGTAIVEKMYINRPVNISVSEDTSFRLFYSPKWLNKGGNIKFIISDYSKDSDIFEITTCPTLYARYLSSPSDVQSNSVQKFTNKIYPEGFVSSANDVMNIDGGREYPIRTAYDGETSNLTVNIEKDGGTRTITIPVISVHQTSAQNKKMFVLCIGESTTAAIVRNPYKNKVDVCYGWPSSMQHFADIDNLNIGNINVKTLGTKHWQFEQASDARWEYNGELYTQRSFMEGWGGWTIFNMMYWAAHFVNLNPSSSNPVNTSEMLWNLLGLATKTPYTQTSYNEQREEFTNSAEQITLITQTPFLKYKIDGTSAVYEAIKTFAASADYDYPEFERTDEYSGTQEQIDAMNAWGLELANNPVNPFYSLEKVRGGSDVAFSLEKYIERYRTMDDEGNRLSGNAGETVTGLDGKTYTIGTRVTNVNAYDVCSPTHIIFNMGINENINNTVANAVAAIKTAMAQFTLPTAYFMTRIPGVCNPAMWPDIITRKMSSDIIAFQHEVLVNIKPWFESQTNKYLLPIWQIQPPTSVLYNFVEGCFNGNEDKQILNASNSNVHPSYDAYRAIGWQCLNWLYYTCTLN